MSGVLIELDKAYEFGIDIPVIEQLTGRKVSALWRESTWADTPDGSDWSIPEELREFAVGSVPGTRHIMSGLSIYFDVGPMDDDTEGS